MSAKEKVLSGAAGIVISAVLLFTFYGLPDQKPTHFCTDKEITAHCDSLSKFYGLENGQCNNDFYTNKRCRSGWEIIYEQKSIRYVCDKSECMKE